MGRSMAWRRTSVPDRPAARSVAREPAGVLSRWTIRVELSPRARRVRHWRSIEFPSRAEREPLGAGNGREDGMYSRTRPFAALQRHAWVVNCGSLDCFRRHLSVHHLLVGFPATAAIAYGPGTGSAAQHHTPNPTDGRRSRQQPLMRGNGHRRGRPSDVVRSHIHVQPTM